jgi:hypothetical protein
MTAGDRFRPILKSRANDGLLAPDLLPTPDAVGL